VVNEVYRFGNSPADLHRAKKRVERGSAYSLKALPPGRPGLRQEFGVCCAEWQNAAIAACPAALGKDEAHLSLGL
jgi:hypothetical protein